MPKASFKPGRALTFDQRAGDVTNGESWIFWRYDSLGEPWYKRSDVVTTEPKQLAAADGTIHGVPAADTINGVPSAIHKAEFLEANK